jgi:hypothetical protein
MAVEKSLSNPVDEEQGEGECGTVTSYQLSVISYQLSEGRGQMANGRGQLSVISYQLSVLVVQEFRSVG